MSQASHETLELRIAECRAPLEPVTQGDLLWVVQARPISPTVVVGSVAAAATTGALVAMGHRLGSVGLPFAAIGAVLFHPTASLSSARMVAAGLLLHAVAIFIWSAVCVKLAAVFSRRDLTAGVTAVSQFVLSWAIAWSTGNGLATALALGDRLVYTMVLAIALVVGMRFAFPSPQNARSDAPVT
jgi:hypothetical protein